MAEDRSKSSRLGHPSTILRLCNRAGVLFEDADTDRVKGGRGITKQRMEGITDTQQERRPQGRRRRRPQMEEGQASSAIDLSQMQSTIEKMSRQYMRDKEQQEQYMRAQEQQENWQLKMMEQQENFQLKMMDQQREFHARFLEQQREQSSQSQESFDKLFQQQAEHEKYIQNLYQWKNIYHTAGEQRYLDRIEYDIETQSKLNYIACDMPVVNREIKPFVQCQELVNNQRARAQRNIERMEQRLKEVGL
ncbi:probable serine/threonine-protein kinase irlF [Arachis ipaensis]|uniref:probable serine/threonine-protein kinase irlF n=1 Tax=Arachis ipaensis TaxID=130454 RepID=UPI0007AF5436|nr:probable serine/threonine-protein kinase irlF [Arachis ipaensis]XP_025628358.1 probable serine/threonine-protein kinase irlF [Arachis hypogaea]